MRAFGVYRLSSNLILMYHLESLTRLCTRPNVAARKGLTAPLFNAACFIRAHTLVYGSPVPPCVTVKNLGLAHAMKKKKES